MRAEVMAKSDRSKTAAGFLYDALHTPLCVFNNEADRREIALALAVYSDGSQPGEHTLRALEAFEPHVVWARHFLEVRKTCYSALHDPRAEQASRDFDEFIKHEPSTADTSALTEKIESHSVDKTSDVNSNKFDRGRLHY